ncbi:YjbQ family protein, partial [Thiolapillus sp.]|uniref:YjbQ family protein n=1 Tax=Thiolapillus sp. TaxID=2017437 RepID=UPI003AF4F211
VGPSETIPLVDGKLGLSTWQNIFFCEFDGPRRERHIVCTVQACLRPRDRFWDIPVPKIDSAFDNLFVPQPSWSPSTTQQLRKLVAAPYLPPNDWTPRSEAYFVFPLAQGTPGKQCGLAATGVYQPSLRSPWLAAEDCQ